MLYLPPIKSICVRLSATVFFIVFIGISKLFGQTSDDYLQTRLEKLHQTIELRIAQAQPEQKFAILEQSKNHLHALNSYTNLGTLSIFDKMQDLDAAEIAGYNYLEALVNDNDSSPAHTKEQVDSFVATLPVVKNQFVLKPIKPIYYYTATDSVITIMFTGSFPLLLKDTAEVYLFAGNLKVPYTAYTDSSITFRFSQAQLGLHHATPWSATKLNLRLVGQTGKKINKKKQFTAVYSFYAMALPPSPGKLTISYGASSTNAEKQAKRTRTFLLNGSKGNLVEKQCIPNHDGWTVVPESVDLVVESSAGQKNRDWNYRKTNTGGKTCFTAEVFFNSAGPSGKLEYHLKYDITRSTSDTKNKTTEVVLEWGKEQQLDFDMPITKLQFTDFAGNTTVVAGNSHNNFWLQIDKQDKALLVKPITLPNN